MAGCYPPPVLLFGTTYKMCTGVVTIVYAKCAVCNGNLGPTIPRPKILGSAGCERAALHG